MTEQHQHHHPQGHAHPPVAPEASILRLSAAARLALVGVPIALLWVAVYWAVR